MHIRTLLTLALAAPLLVACDNSPPPAKPAATAESSAKPAVAPTQSAKVVVGAKPLLGTWASDLGTCGDANAVTVISTASYQANGKSCDIALTANSDGSFTTQCGSEKLTLTPVFAPSGEGVNVVVGKGKRQTVLRCSR